MTSEIIYRGKLRSESKHSRSGDIIITDAPVDNNGKGEAFSPTDLTSTSLGNCMLTIMGLRAQKMEIDLNGTKASVTKHMASNPRRINAIDIKIIFPELALSKIQKEILEKAATTCPVALSLHPEIDQNVSFEYC